MAEALHTPTICQCGGNLPHNDQILANRCILLRALQRPPVRNGSIGELASKLQALSKPSVRDELVGDLDSRLENQRILLQALQAPSVRSGSVGELASKLQILYARGGSVGLRIRQVPVVEKAFLKESHPEGVDATKKRSEKDNSGVQKAVSSPARRKDVDVSETDESL